MCGIAGIISSFPDQFDSSSVLKMTRALAHRGPDGEAYWINERSTVLLGHRRLAIIDLSAAANQPMKYKNRYYIIHNGEVYNYIELRETLIQKGYHFSSKSDTEVIAAAYDFYKEKCLSFFDGMFAFAIWDEQEKILFAARDRFGEKPFYYYTTNNDFYFASELKALWAIGLPRNIDESMLLNFLALGNTTHPTDNSKTFYTNFYKLPPGHFLYFDTKKDSNALGITRYWELDKEINIPGTTEEAIGKFNGLFQQSVNKRLRADVMIGTSLSGGLDSSSIIASIQTHGSVHINYTQQAFTAGFPEYEKDETSHAKQVAIQFGLQHYFTNPSAKDLSEDLEKLIQHHEEPINSASVYAQYKVFELAKQHDVTILLDGQGADELLAGYSKYFHWYLQELLAKRKFGLFLKEKELLTSRGIPFDWSFKNSLAAFMPRLAAKKLTRRITTGILNNNMISEEFKKAYSHSDLFYKPAIRSLQDILSYNITIMGLEELLRYADKNSMAHGREVRLPFLQHELVQFICSLPSSFKIRDGYTKWILRKSMEPVLAPQIVWLRDKTGFEPPQKKWMENVKVQELISDAKQKLVNHHILNASVLTKKIQPHSSYAAEANDWRFLASGLLLP